MRLEQELSRLHEQRTANEAALAEPGLYEPANKAELRRLLEVQRQLATDIAGTEEAWLVAAEQYEAAALSEIQGIDASA